MKTLNRLLIAAAFLTIGLSARAEGLGGNAKRSPFSLEIGAGLPQLISLQTDIAAGNSFEFGVGAGIAPVSGRVNDKLGSTTANVDLGNTHSYQLQPSTTFNLVGFYPFLRYYPWNSNFYLQAAFEVLIGWSKFGGTLQDLTSNQSYSDVITGSFSTIKSSFTLSIGYRPSVTSDFFMNFGLGVSWYHDFSYDLSVGGTLPSGLTATPAGQQRFNQAVANLQNQLSGTLDQYRSTPAFLPSATFSLGWGF